MTIIPRGPALGVTQQLPAEDRLSYSKEWAENRIAICLGGRIAEELVFGQMTTGAGNDIEKATELARKMVCEWGMSEKMGPLTFGKKEEQIFLGRDLAQQPGLLRGDRARHRRRGQAHRHGRLRARQQGAARATSSSSSRIAEALLEYETIDGEDIDVVLGGGTDRAPPAAGRRRAPVVEAAKEKRPSHLRPPARSRRKSPRKPSRFVSSRAIL